MISIGRDNPYVGPRTFTREDADRFFGRENEALDLLSLVASERLVLFHAQSGSGKSSLLHTRLLPRLVESEGFVAFPIGRVSGEPPAGIGAINNIFTFNLMLSLDSSDTDPEVFTQLDLVTFFSRLFTKDGKTYHYKADALPLSADDVAQEPPHILVIDQFEEIINTHLDRWQDRAEFFSQLEQLMQVDPLLWVVLTLREDYVAALQPYARLMQNNMRARFYMQRMGAAAAQEAIEQPARLAGRPFAPGVAQSLVDNLRQIKTQIAAESHLGQYVEPVQLQVVCFQLWQNLQDRPAGEITQADVDELGDVDTALAQFYEQALAHVLQEIPSSEIALRSWFDQELITEAETRGIVYQGETDTAGLDNDIVTLLANQFLLRAEMRAGGTWYELVHDRFVEPILLANRKWRATRTPLIQATLDWDESGRPEAKLFVGAQLEAYTSDQVDNQTEPVVVAFLTACQQADAALREKEAQRERELAQAQALAEAERKRAEVQEAAAQQLRRRAYFLIAALAVAILLAVATFFFFQNSQKSELAAIASQGTAVAESTRAFNNEGTAVAEAANAVAAQSTAEAESERADENFATAVFNENLAQTNAEVAQENANIAEANEQDANVQRTVANAQSLQQGNQLQTSTLLALFAYLATESAQAEQILRQNITQLAKPTILGREQDSLNDVAFSRDGLWLAVAGDNGRIGKATLWDVASGEPVVQIPHDSGVVSLAFSPDNKILATGDIGSAYLWQAGTNERLSTLRHGGEVHDILFSPDGSKVATAGFDQTAQIWDVATGDRLFTLPHEDIVVTLAFSPDGQQLITGADIGRIWDVATGVEIATMPHDGLLFAVTFSPDGQLIATASADRTARIWDAASGQLLSSYIHDGYVRDIAFSPDGQWVSTVSEDNQVRVWDLTTGQERQMSHDDLVRHLAINPQNNWVASISKDQTARLWDPNTAQEMGILYLDGEGAKLAFTPDGTQLATITTNGNVQIWNLTAIPRASRQIIHNDLVEKAVFHPDGTHILTASADFSTRLWPLTTTGDEVNVDTAEMRNMADYDALIQDIALTTDGTRLATASLDSAIIQDSISGEILHSFEDNNIVALAFSPDNTKLVTTNRDGNAVIWDVDDGQEISTLNHGRDNVLAVSYHPAGEKLATSTDSGTVTIWDAESGEETNTLLHDAQPVYAVMYSADGKWLATAGSDQTVRLWEVATIHTGKSAADPFAVFYHDTAVLDIAFSPDNQWLATAGADDMLRIWEVASGDEIARLAHNAPINSVDFSQDGNWLLSSSGDIVNIWNMAQIPFIYPEDLVGETCQRVTRNLSEDEWEQYLGSFAEYETICNIEE